jgi:hypothetical protein
MVCHLNPTERSHSSVSTLTVHLMFVIIANDDDQKNMLSKWLCLEE